MTARLSAVLLGALLMAGQARAVDASALIGPACFARVRVEDAGAKQRKLDSAPETEKAPATLT